MKNLLMYTISLGFCGFLLFNTAAQAKPDCAKVRGTGNTAAVSQGVFQGTAVLDFSGQTRNANVTTYLLGAPRAGEDGTLHANTSHTFAFAGGSSFVTDDRAVLSPTETPGVYNLNTRAAITGGTGSYASAGGSLNIHGTINLITGQVSWRFNGRVCNGG